MKLRVSSIDNSLSKDQLWNLFAEFGEVDSIKLFRGMDQTSPTCLGFVIMDSTEAANEAVKYLDGEQVGNYQIGVEHCHDTVRVKNRTWKPISLDEEDIELSPEVMYETSIDEDPFTDDF